MWSTMAQEQRWEARGSSPKPVTTVAGAERQSSAPNFSGVQRRRGSDAEGRWIVDRAGGHGLLRVQGERHHRFVRHLQGGANAPARGGCEAEARVRSEEH